MPTRVANGGSCGRWSCSSRSSKPKAKATETPMPLVTLQNVSIRFRGPTVLDGVDFQIDPGERIALMGRNGEGKSTLLRLIQGELEPDAGEIIRIEGISTALLSQRIPPGLAGKVFDVVASSETLDTSLRVLRAGGTLSIVGIGKEVMPDPTTLWLKLQTLKGVYVFGYTNVRGKREHIFEIAIDLARQKKVSLEPMLTHTFRIEDYRQMIDVNLSKAKHRAVKTAVSFEPNRG